MSEQRFPIVCKIADLQLGDVVEVFTGPWGTGIVQQIKEDIVTIFRPYGTSDNFSYTGGVICYTGVETIKFAISPRQEFKVYSRKNLK